MAAASLATPAHHIADTSVPLLEGAVADALRRTAARFPDRQALAWAEGDGVGAMTYAELLAEAKGVAAWLLSRGARGDRIAIWSRNELEWILAEYGCALAGMAIASWNPGWTDYECAHARDLTEPRLVLVGNDTRGHSLVDRGRALAGDRMVPLANLRALAANAPLRDLPAPGAEDLFLIQFTSGTTGRAKGAAISNRAALNSAWMRMHALGADESDVFINPCPMNHMGGAISMLLGTMTVGACYVMMQRFDAGEMLRMARLCGATRFGGVPTMMVSILEHPDWAPGAISVRSLGSGGAQVPQPLIERLMREFEAPLLVSYAQSECPMITSSSPGDSPQLLAETVGRIVPHVELKVCDPATGQMLARGESGEIRVRGPFVMSDYFRMPCETADTIDADGFLHTGDVGSLDEAGFLRICGRVRDVIIRGGENIYPAEVEDVILQHSDVIAVAVVGIPDDRWGQQVGAAVTARAGCALTAKDLEAHVATRIAHFKVPRHWLFVEAMPLTVSGKIRKVDVEAMFQPDAIAGA
jgi:fatty-acyl-CoA synthase